MTNEKLIKIIKYYGETNQKIKTVEELSELSVAITHDLAGKEDPENIIEEIADVWVMMNQLIMIYGISEKLINKIADEKIQRTLERMKNENCNSWCINNT